MYTFITILILVVSLLLILIVLVQNSKGGGLAAGFSSPNQIMGAPKTADFLEKATWTLAGTLFVLCIVSAAFVSNGEMGATSVIKDQVEQATKVDPNMPAPGVEAPAPAATPAAAPTATPAPAAAPAQPAQ